MIFLKYHSLTDNIQVEQKKNKEKVRKHKGCWKM